MATNLTTIEVRLQANARNFKNQLDKGSQGVEKLRKSTQKVIPTQKTFQEPDEYIEGTVRPDRDGKMKDVDFYIDDADHLELKKIADEGTYDTSLPDIDDID